MSYHVTKTSLLLLPNHLTRHCSRSQLQPVRCEIIPPCYSEKFRKRARHLLIPLRYPDTSQNSKLQTLASRRPPPPPPSPSSPLLASRRPPPIDPSPPTPDPQPTFPSCSLSTQSFSRGIPSISGQQRQIRRRTSPATDAPPAQRPRRRGRLARRHARSSMRAAPSSWPDCGGA